MNQEEDRVWEEMWAEYERDMLISNETDTNWDDDYDYEEEDWDTREDDFIPY